MTIAANVIDAIGKTPLIELRAASKATGCRILGKAEFMNPGGSVKDRAALYIVRDAIARGTLAPGGLIVEGTAGEYRHWPRPGRQCARLFDRHRHSGNAVAREERHIALARRAACRSARRPLRQSQ